MPLKRRESVLLLCSAATATEPLVLPLEVRNMNVTVAASRSDAILKLKDNPFDMLIVEAQLDGASGLAFLAETRRYVPNLLRAVLDNTEGGDLPWLELINDVAPSAVFQRLLDVDKIVELIDTKRSETQSMRKTEEDETIAELMLAFNDMLKESDIALPVLPEIANQVERLLVDPTNTFKKIGEWVRREPSMAGRIVQAANSPIYASRVKIRSLSQAVARIGLRETRSILQAVIVESLFKTSVERAEQRMRELWLHSLCTAYCNERIGQILNIPESEDFFMMGLLHDIGKLLILQLVETGRKRGMWTEEQVDDQIIRKLIIKRHCVMGERLVKSWHYPMAFQEVIRRHDDTDYKSCSEAVIVTHVSNFVTNNIGYRFAPAPHSSISDLEIAKALNMTPRVQKEIEETLIEIIERIKLSCFAEFHSRPLKDEECDLEN